MPYFLSTKNGTQPTTNQSTSEVLPWPKIEFRITATTGTKDTLIPAKQTSNVKIPIRAWDVTWASMWQDDLNETLKESHTIAGEAFCLSLEPDETLLLG
jgi:hypothetical protein